jgi:hypothetical protein
VAVRREELILIFNGGVSHAFESAYATPIGPKLRGLSDEKQASFRQAMTYQLNVISKDGKTIGRMVSNIVSAEKPA